MCGITCNVGALKSNCAGTCLVLACYHIEKCRLSGTIGTDNRMPCPVLYRDIYTSQHDELGKVFFDISQFQDAHDSSWGSGTVRFQRVFAHVPTSSINFDRPPGTKITMTININPMKNGHRSVISLRKFWR